MGAGATLTLLVLLGAGCALAAHQQPCAAPWLHQPAALEAPPDAAEAAGSLVAEQLPWSSRLSLLKLQQLLRVPVFGRATSTEGGDSISSSSRSSSSARWHRRHLLHLDAAESADAAEAAERGAAAMMYPREAAAVQRYLADALRSGQVPIEVPVWFVVVTGPGSPPAANITTQQVVQQVALLNRAYATGLPAELSSRQLWRFRLMGVRHVSSSDGPMCIGSKADERIKQQLHPQLAQATLDAGHSSADRTLVVYTTDLTSPACANSVPGYRALFGWSNTPMELQAWKQRQQAYKDGVVLDHKFLYKNDAIQAELGSKSMNGATTGAQLVHEVGHWQGLLHTFVGGCSASAGSTDAVDDTPAEAHPRSWSGVDLGDASGGCQARDTCPDLPGQDPVDNYMTYNNLACARAFTPGQQARMLFAFERFRAATK